MGVTWAERVGHAEDEVEVGLDLAADFLGLDEVVVEAGGGEGEGAEEDAALDFGAEVRAAVGGVEALWGWGCGVGWWFGWELCVVG